MTLNMSLHRLDGRKIGNYFFKKNEAKILNYMSASASVFAEASGFALRASTRQDAGQVRLRFTSLGLRPSGFRLRSASYDGTSRPRTTT